MWKFDIKKCCYGDEEKAYLTRKRAGLTVNQWEVSIIVCLPSHLATVARGD